MGSYNIIPKYYVLGVLWGQILFVFWSLHIPWISDVSSTCFLPLIKLYVQSFQVMDAFLIDFIMLVSTRSACYAFAPILCTLCVTLQACPWKVSNGTVFLVCVHACGWLSSIVYTTFASHYGSNYSLLPKANGKERSLSGVSTLHNKLSGDSAVEFSLADSRDTVVC